MATVMIYVVSVANNPASGRLTVAVNDHNEWFLLRIGKSMAKNRTLMVDLDFLGLRTSRMTNQR